MNPEKEGMKQRAPTLKFVFVKTKATTNTTQQNNTTAIGAPATLSNVIGTQHRFSQQEQAHFITSGTVPAQVYPDKFLFLMRTFAKQGMEQARPSHFGPLVQSALCTYRELTERKIIAIVMERDRHEEKDEIREEMKEEMRADRRDKMRDERRKRDVLRIPNLQNLFWR